MQWPIILVAREDFNQRPSAELDQDSDDPYRREIAQEIQTVSPASKMSRIRNPDWENDDNLKADIQKYVLKNLTRREVRTNVGSNKKLERFTFFVGI